MCGYNIYQRHNLLLLIGSSPRVRVQQQFIMKIYANGGIIPACAGTTGYGEFWRFKGRDHPRVCGYNFLFLNLCQQLLGSSPRVRVQLFCTPFASCSFRIIPACAGTTSSFKSKSTIPRDHPRVCGYNITKPLNLFTVPGSSPRVRVQLDFGYLKHCTTGIIPACAGTTNHTLPMFNRSRDHPRVCGYNMNCII